MSNTKEQRIRRELRKIGYSLHKSRKAISSDNLGEYMVVDDSLNAVILGANYDYTLDDIEKWLNESEDN